MWYGRWLLFRLQICVPEYNLTFPIMVSGPVARSKWRAFTGNCKALDLHGCYREKSIPRNCQLVSKSLRRHRRERNQQSHNGELLSVVPLPVQAM
jgi:hypothetical protein